MPTPEQQQLAVILLVLLGPKAVTWAAARFVSKKDEAEKRVVEAEKEAKAEREKRDKEAAAAREQREKDIAAERDRREKAMALKLEEIASSINELRSDARADRERQAALTAAHAEVKERINGVSENHRPRIERLEQKVAVLEAAASKKR